MIFSYRQYRTKPTPTTGDILFRPEVSVRFIGPSGEKVILALVDPGSDDSIFPLSIGSLIGVNLDPTKKWRVEGIAGQQVELVPGKVDLELQGSGQIFRWSITMGFIAFDKPENEVAVLGHAGFLNFFSATFDGLNHSLELVPNSNFPGTIT